MTNPRIFSLTTLTVFLLSLLAACNATPTPQPTEVPTRSLPPTYTPTVQPTMTTTPLPGDAVPAFLLSMYDNGYAHLFAFAPSLLNPIRLTNGQWDDVSPSLSPDGSKLVFASNRNNYWDIYFLDLKSGQTSRFTDTPEFDGDPSWSPDSQWIVFDTYIDSNLEIMIHSTVDPNQAPIRLTNNPGVDQQPVWSPKGRQIAFSSNRTGDDEIWIANLDQPDNNRFIDVSNSPDSSDTHPVWSPDGSRLAWVAKQPGQPDSIYVWDTANPKRPPLRVGTGSWAAWNDNGDQLAALITAPNQNYLTAYTLDGTITLQTTPVGPVRGLQWRLLRIGSLATIFQQAALITPTPLWSSLVQLYTDVPGSRSSVVKLDDVQAPHPYLLDAVDEGFYALRRRLIQETGWDVLANLQEAYTPLTSTLDPGKEQDWLYTGRAFALNPLLLNAGWMLVVREDHDGQAYWRVYLRAVAQDGSQGEPLRDLPWDLNARYNLDPQAYQEGGQPFKSIPSGYWVDFTTIADEYGWQRIASQEDWRTYFDGIQFNEFVITGGLDWRSAMLQIYPPDIFITPTTVLTLTPTLTPTPTGYYYKTATPTVTFTPTMNPTFTPSP